MSTSNTPLDSASTTAIRATQIVKSYTLGKERIEILHGVSLELKYGEMVAIMGPSGSGKSTLMYCLSGLEECTGGHVTLGDRQLDSYSRADLARMRRSEIGFVFQSYNLIPTLSAFENIALTYRLRHLRPPIQKIETILTTLGLGHLSKALPSSMSGGEQQRVALARALAQEPRIIFADEPTGALDTRSGTTVLSELKKIAHNPEQTVLIVTHDPSVAAQCDRILFMKDGRLERELKPSSIKEVANVLVLLSENKEER